MINSAPVTDVDGETQVAMEWEGNGEQARKVNFTHEGGEERGARSPEIDSPAHTKAAESSDAGMFLAMLNFENRAKACTDLLQTTNFDSHTDPGRSGHLRTPRANLDVFTDGQDGTQGGQ